MSGTSVATLPRGGNTPPVPALDDQQIAAPALNRGNTPFQHDAGDEPFVDLGNQAGEPSWAAEEGEPTPGTPPAPAPAPTPAPAAPKPPPVPYARFEEVNALARQREQDVAYWRGRAEALAAAAQGATPSNQQPAQQATTQPQSGGAADPNAALKDVFERAVGTIQAADQAIVSAFAAYDAGELTMEQAAAPLTTAIRQTIDAWLGYAEARHRQDMAQLVAQMRQEFGQPSLADAQIIEEQIAELGQKHPWVEHLTEAELQHLTRIAYTEAAAAGRPYGKGNAESMRLRAHVAELSDRWGPTWHPEMLDPVNRATETAARPRSRAQLRQPTDMRQIVAERADLAARMPPAPTGGSSSRRTPDGVPDDAQVAAMDFRTLRNLPDALLDRLTS